MLHFSQTHSILFFSIVSSISFLISFIIYKLAFLIPKKLHQQWHAQSLEYLNSTNHHTSPSQFSNQIQTIQIILLACFATLLPPLVIWYFGINTTALANLFLIGALLLLALIDYKTYLLPDCLTLPLLWLGLLCNSFELFVSLSEAVWGAAIGYTGLWLIAAVFKYCRRQEGMGHGDFKLLAVFGAWWGIYSLPWIVMLGSLLGASIGLIPVIRNRDSLQKPIPFGPYLIFAGVLIMFFRRVL